MFLSENNLFPGNAHVADAIIGFFNSLFHPFIMFLENKQCFNVFFMFKMFELYKIAYLYE